MEVVLIVVAGSFGSFAECETAKPWIKGAEVTRYECMAVAEAAPSTSPRPIPKPDGGGE